MILVIGEILFDVFPDYRRLGGAPFNFAYHLKNFGFDVRFVSRIGEDDAGKEIMQKLERYQFNLDDIQIDDALPTGSVNVQLDKNGAPLFDIISDVAYDYIKFKPELHSTMISEARLIYFGSLVQRSNAGYQNLQAFISRKPPESYNFYDINLRPNCYNDELIQTSLLKTDILKLSAEELEKIKQLNDVNAEPDAFIPHLMEAYTLETVSLTKGALGSELFTGQGRFSSEPVEGITVVDTVGAGDAYAAMLAAGMLRNLQPQEILQRASLFAARICEIKGAIPESSSFYEPFKSPSGGS